MANISPLLVSQLHVDDECDGLKSNNNHTASPTESSSQGSYFPRTLLFRPGIGRATERFTSSQSAGAKRVESLPEVEGCIVRKSSGSVELEL